MVIGELVGVDDIMQVGRRTLAHHVDLCQHLSRMLWRVHVEEADDVLGSCVLSQQSQNSDLPVRPLGQLQRVKGRRELLDSNSCILT